MPIINILRLDKTRPGECHTRCCYPG